MKRVWKAVALFAYRRWSKGSPDATMPVGVPGNRDPEHPCTAYAPRPFELPDWNDCETDGHYLCRDCVHRKRDLFENEVAF